MSVESPQISIDPYKSTVPLAPPVQIPREDLQPQQAPAIYSKAGGIAQFADTAMKGLLKGLQLKEQKKYETAQAVMSAQDAGISAAKKNYDDMLTTKGAFEADGKTPKAETQAAYAAWQTAVNTAAEQRQQFAVPEKTAKPKKGEKKADKAKDGAPAQGGFGASLKQFFERNPHIVPELAIIGMKAQLTPYGQMAPEQQAAKRQEDAAQRQESIQKVTDAAVLTRDKYAGRSESELQKMPPSEGGKAAGFKNALEEYRNAVESLTPLNAATKYQTLVDPQGQQHSVPLGTQIPEGWKVYEKPLASQTARVGTEQEFTGQALKAYGYDKDTAPPALLKYLHDSWAYKAAQTTSGTSEHMVTDPNTNELVAVKTGSSTTRGAAAPKPPAGFSPLGENGLPQESATAKPAGDTASSAAAPKTGKMSKPPAAPGAGKGTMTAAPLPPGVRDTGLRAMPGAQNTERVETQEKNMYATATKNYEAALKTNKAKAPDKASLDAANAQAQAAYDAEKAQITLWKAKQVKAVGGDPWKAQAKGADGKIYATMDGTNWVNVETGYPYQEK